MTVSSLGGDLEQLAALRATFDQQSQALEQVTGTIRSQLAGTMWHGPAADRFRGAWSGDFEPSLRRLQQALQEAAAELARRRDALMQAGA
jgi:WXG100 family type VII secretion target